MIPTDPGFQKEVTDAIYRRELLQEPIGMIGSCIDPTRGTPGRAACGHVKRNQLAAERSDQLLYRFRVIRWVVDDALDIGDWCLQGDDDVEIADGQPARHECIRWSNWLHWHHKCGASCISAESSQRNSEVGSGHAIHPLRSADYQPSHGCGRGEDPRIAARRQRGK